MALNIIACVKSTPTTVNVSVDSGTNQVKTDGLTFGMNPFDEFSVEEVVRLKEKNEGSNTTALTVGPDAADSVLREAIARGIQNGVRVGGPEFEGGDSYATSFALAEAIKKLHAEKPVNLVLFGKNTNDGASGMVGGQVAEWLDWPSVISVKKIEAIDEKTATVHRAMEDGVDVIKVTLPAVLCTVKEINEPRLPSLKGKMAAKKAQLKKFTAADLAIKPEQAGAQGATSKIVKFSTPAARPAGMKIEGETSAEKAKKLVDTLIERKLI